MQHGASIYPSLIVAAISVVLVTSTCAPGSSEYRFYYGIISRDIDDSGRATRIYRSDDSMTVSRARLAASEKSKRNGIGYLVEAPPEVEYFTVHSVQYLPGVPEKLKGPFAAEYSPKDAVGGLETNEKMFYRKGWEVFDLQPGDPLGEYRVEIYINGERMAEAVFTVEP